MSIKDASPKGGQQQPRTAGKTRERYKERIAKKQGCKGPLRKLLIPIRDLPIGDPRDRRPTGGAHPSTRACSEGGGLRLYLLPPPPSRNGPGDVRGLEPTGRSLVLGVATRRTVVQMWRLVSQAVELSARCNVTSCSVLPRPHRNALRSDEV